MADETPPLIAPDADDAAERSLVDDLRQMVDDGRTLVEAELAYQKSRALVAGQGAKGIVGWGALALVLVFFALMALVMGLLLALSELVGGWLAMVIVVLGLLLAAGLAGMAAGKRWERMSRQLSDSEPG
ncbi:phage holin family protein [Novosphingobium sp.]|uniref:phage holin family protein n=1 Tax=Novosphingobium sp. TaxID=1874826 RepID=UPI0025D499FD|nr:phage holin family protein [Novosphingobium sp.]MCC6925886.1 phage holin family protein [Novosphingobium sp.]